MNGIKRFFASVALTTFCVAMSYAQNIADQLYMKGQNLATVMTVASQRSAITKFKAAKVKYLSADKKLMCDNQIKICNNTIKRLSKPAARTTTKPTSKATPAEEKKVEEVKRKDIALSISPTRLDYEFKPKDGATQSVDVDCNYEDWKAETDSTWITVYTADKKFTVEVAENTTEAERSGIVKVTCGDKTIDLVVNQDKPTQFGKVKNAIGGLFKKKKKK